MQITHTDIVELAEGDSEAVLEYQLRDRDDEPVDLTEASVRFGLVHVESETVVVNTQATVVDAPAGRVEYQLDSGETGRAGRHVGEFTVTFPDSDSRSYPRTTDLVLYVDEALANANEAADPAPELQEGPRGPPGPPGPKGDPFEVDAQGTDRSQYDSESEGFAYLNTSTGDVYFKQSDAVGDWSEPVPFRGPEGPEGPAGPQGEQGPQGPEGPQGPQGPAGEGAATSVERGDGTSMSADVGKLTFGNGLSVSADAGFYPSSALTVSADTDTLATRTWVNENTPSSSYPTVSTVDGSTSLGSASYIDLASPLTLAKTKHDPDSVWVDTAEIGLDESALPTSPDTHTAVSQTGSTVLSDVNDLNFTGSGVVAVSDDGDGSATVEVEDTDTDTDTHVDVAQNGTTVLSGVSTINLKGTAIESVTDAGSGQVDVTVSGGSSDAGGGGKAEMWLNLDQRSLAAGESMTQVFAARGGEKLELFRVGANLADGGGSFSLEVSISNLDTNTELYADDATPFEPFDPPLTLVNDVFETVEFAVKNSGSSTLTASAVFGLYRTPL